MREKQKYVKLEHFKSDTEIVFQKWQHKTNQWKNIEFSFNFPNFSIHFTILFNRIGCGKSSDICDTFNRLMKESIRIRSLVLPLIQIDGGHKSV